MPSDFYKNINDKPESSLYSKYFTMNNNIPIHFNKYDYILIPIKLSNSNIWHIVSLSFSEYICSFYSCIFKQNNTTEALEVIHTITFHFDNFLQLNNMANANQKREWNYHHIQPIPYVNRNISCSLSLVCLNFISRDVSMNINSNDLYYYTILIIIEILNGKLYTY